MQITHVQALYPEFIPTPSGWRTHLWQIAVRVETDQGIAGWGYGGGGEAALPIINGHFRELLLGRSLNSTTEIQTLWDDLYRASIPYGRKGIAIMALSGVDLALWDALGQAEGVPVAHLIQQESGQPLKSTVRAYATGADGKWYAEQGFTAHKFSPSWVGDGGDYDRTEATAQAARALFGPDALLMADCYMAWDGAIARQMAQRLAPYQLYWFEDLLTPDALTGQAALRGQLGAIQVAGGEHEFTQYGFREIAAAGALDIWQPDITWCGGITAGLRIVELAQSVGAQVVPHRGGEVWGLHLIAATACADLAEVLPGSRQRPASSIWQGEPQATNGFLTLSDAPGFGVTLAQ